MSDAAADLDDIDGGDENDLSCSEPFEEVTGPDWFDCPILRPAEMFAKIKACGGLDGRSVNLFAVLERPARSDLLELYLRDNLYRPGSHYIYATPDPSRYGLADWRPVVTKWVAETNLFGPCALFSNTLSWGDAPPSERTCNAGFAVYTVELDHTPLTDQLKIIWSGRLKRIDTELCRFRDYRGCEVVYSGNKSVHFHFVFDLRHLKRDLIAAGNSSYLDNWTCDLPDVLLRPAYKICWERLAALFRDISEVDDDPDPDLGRWEQLRRCPWALRHIRGAHPLGLPSDHRIRQVVLSRNVFKNTKQGATMWFHEPGNLLEVCSAEQVRRRLMTFARPEIAVTSREVELFDQHASAAFRDMIGAEYPKFARWEGSKFGFKCFFYNGPDDQRPSSFCDGNRNRIVLQGRHTFGSDGMALAATPNQIFDWIVAQHGASLRSAGADAAPDDWIMPLYKPAVYDRDSLAKFLDDHLVDMVASPAASAIPDWISKLLDQRQSPNTHVLIRGPQGCGKSTKMMRKIPAIYDIDPGVTFFSSPSIQQAAEKVDAFRHENKDERFAAFLYLSLSALYEQYCPLPDRLDHLDILEEGGSSWLHAVYERQRGRRLGAAVCKGDCLG